MEEEGLRAGEKVGREGGKEGRKRERRWQELPVSREGESVAFYGYFQS